MRFLPEVYKDLGYPEGIPDVKEFSKVFAKIDLKDDVFTTEVYDPGTSGESKLLRHLTSFIETKN